ncbi:hypothetical protein AG1IA_06841 [Rhizoctonia solani AG-1 IA]|uniref:Uncharacterized protein n=1 Tax=Thanatephorus cucumeris (strain AG1-IA) TaxID=983506 RepID=L8WQR7_THACA|nr:hypothetical protein AG1IA_06841 [Rhizoctonia solani AG-1 IA]
MESPTSSDLRRIREFMLGVEEVKMMHESVTNIECMPEVEVHRRFMGDSYTSRQLSQPL